MITLPYFTNEQSRTRGGRSNLSQVTRLVGNTTRIPPVFCTTPRRPLCGTSGWGRPRRGKAARVGDADAHRPLPGLLRTAAPRASSQPRPFQPRAGAPRAPARAPGGQGGRRPPGPQPTPPVALRRPGSPWRRDPLAQPRPAGSPGGGPGPPRRPSPAIGGEVAASPATPFSRLSRRPGP